MYIMTCLQQVMVMTWFVVIVETGGTKNVFLYYYTFNSILETIKSYNFHWLAIFNHEWFTNWSPRKSLFKYQKEYKCKRKTICLYHDCANDGFVNMDILSIVNVLFEGNVNFTNGLGGQSPILCLTCV